jgi:hypothetical protein
MNAKLHHNGCDTLMLGFDYELRRRGYAGNSCQVVLQLSRAIDTSELERRVADQLRSNPILAARPVRGFSPRWKPTDQIPRVRVHTRVRGLEQQLFNEPLDLARGELVRFDVIDRTVVFTWAHALMDAKSAEYFLALIGGNTGSVVETGDDWYAERGTAAGGLRARGKLAWRSLERLEQFKKALPVSLATRRPPRGPMKYQVVALIPDEAARVQVNSNRLCGFLGEMNFQIAAALVELHRLHQRLNCPSPSYVVPIPVGLRPKGTRAPLFSNQVTMMMHQFFPEDLATMEQAAAAVKTHKADALREAQIDSSIALGQLFRRLPLRFYMGMVKRELGGEICSFFFGDTAAVDPALQDFLGARIETLAHVPAVTVPPGIGVVFYRFGAQRLFTFVFADGTLNDGEATGFVDALRARLLNP